VKQNEKLIKRTIEKEVEIEESICHLGLEFFFYMCDQATSMSTHYDNDFHVVE
jgi:hypothetical protein